MVTPVVSSLAFLKEHKILKHSDYTTCYQKGQKYYTKNFVVFAYKKNISTEQNNWRAGIAVSKKYGCAVERNRLKRLLREFFRLNQYSLPIDYDLVISPKKHFPAQRHSLELINNELLPAIKKIV